MPEQRALEDLVPRSDARQRRVDHDPFGHALGILRGERIADHVADVVRDEVGLVDVERVHHRGDVGGLRSSCRSRLSGCDERPMPRRSGTIDGVVVRKRRRERRPHVAGVAKAVQQDDRRPLAADADMDRRAVRLECRSVRKPGGNGVTGISPCSPNLARVTVSSLSRKRNRPNFSRHGNKPRLP